MKREEILEAVQSNDNQMDEMQQKDQMQMLVTGAIAETCLGGVLCIFEAIRDGNGNGYMAMINLQLAVCFLAFGIKYRDTKRGKVSILAGGLWAFACVCSIISFFLKAFA